MVPANIKTEDQYDSDEEGVDQPDSLVIAEDDDQEDGLAAFRRTVSN